MFQLVLVSYPAHPDMYKTGNKTHNRKDSLNHEEEKDEDERFKRSVIIYF